MSKYEQSKEQLVIGLQRAIEQKKYTEIAVDSIFESGFYHFLFLD